MNYIASSIECGSRFQIEVEGSTAEKTKVKDLSESSNNVAETLYLFPGFADLQVNGYRDVDMADGNLDCQQIDDFCHQQLSMGVTRFMPTLTTNSLENLGLALENLDQLARQSSLFDAMLLGVHLEGPYISVEDGPRGAHPQQYCRPPGFAEFQQLQEQAGGRIRVVTLSPEYESAERFIQQVVQAGVIVAIGHTAASCAQIRAAVDCGATLSTHLGNGMHTEIARHPNYLWEQLADDRLMAGLIADGVHLDSAVLKTMLRAKGVQRCFLVSDTTHLSGTRPAVYENSKLGDVEVTADRRLVVAGQNRLNAGAYRMLKEGVENLVGQLDVSLEDAIAMASGNPLQFVGHVLPTLDVDQTFVVFKVNPDQRIEILLSVVEKTPFFRA